MNLTAQVLRLTRPLAVLALLLGLLGYGGQAALATTGLATTGLATTGLATTGLATTGLSKTGPAAPARDGYLRLAHLSPNTPPVDVYLYSFGDASAIVVLRHVAYGTVSGYQTVAGGDYTVAMRLAGAAPASKPVLSATVDVAPGHAYTVAGMGPKSGLRLQVIRDRLRCPVGRAMVRVIQASLRQHQVTVTADGHVLSRSQAFATVTPYRAMRPGTWALRVSGASEHATARVSLAAGSIQTLVVLDDPGHLGIMTLEDAAGSSVPPAGGAATGLGGTAPRPGPSPLPWLALAAAGIAVTATGIVRFRRLRWARRAIAHIR
jgi:hypothetical protein